MFKNYLKIAVRNLLKSKGYSLINISGFAIGMAACLIIYHFISYEISFDQLHSKRENIYRLNEVQSFAGINPQKVALSMYPMGPTMKEEFPEIEDFARVAFAPNLLESGDKRIIIENPTRVDPSFLKIFDFELLSGDRSTALIEPHSVLLTEETALKLFGSTDVIGKTFVAWEQNKKVTGIMKNCPANSHLQFDAIFNFSPEDDERYRDGWGSNFLVTYLLLTPGADIAALEAKFPAYLESKRETMSQSYELFLQPLTDVHLGSSAITHDYRNWQKFNRDYIYVFSILAVFVLIIAGINFMNLSTARAMRRGREVGIRKTIGARKKQLVLQFLGESVLLSLISLVIALLTTEVFLPQLNSIIGRELTVSFFSNIGFMGMVAGITIVVGLLSGAYPALFLASFQPVKVLKGSLGSFGSSVGRSTRISLRNFLVVFQFAIAIAFIVGTLITMRQFNFMRDKDPGFNREQVMLINLENDDATARYETLKNEFLEIGGVQDVTGSRQRLGNNIHQMAFKIETPDSVERMSPSQLCVDFNYLSFYGIELKEGRDFSKAFGAERKRAYIINETFVTRVGWDSPLGKQAGIAWEDTLGAVVGVVKDFNFNSLHHKVESLALNVRDWGFSEMSVKVAPDNLQETIAAIETKWNEMVPEYPFQYSFLDDHFEQLYHSDKQVSQIVAIIAGLAIFIACLGLLGLSAIITEQRTKEIAVRKVLGSSVTGVITLLSKDYTKWVVVANLIAWPVGYYVMNRWLQDFAFRIEISWWIFVLAGASALFIALLTVCWQAVRAAMANPVESLRYE